MARQAPQEAFGGLLQSYKTCTEEEPAASVSAGAHTEEDDKSTRRPPALSAFQRAWRRALIRGGATAARKVIGPWRARDAPESRELAVCFLCVDGLPHEAIWRHWARRCSAEANVEIKFYVHAHHRRETNATAAENEASRSWLRDRFVAAHFDTKWGSVDLVRAATAAFAEAVFDRDADAEFVALASETCLPVATPTELAAALFDDDDDDDPKKKKHAWRLRSWVAAFDKPDNGYALEKQWARVAPALPPECVWKAPQWVLLTRAHARLLSKAVAVETRRAFERPSTSRSEGGFRDDSSNRDSDRERGRGGRRRRTRHQGDTHRAHRDGDDDDDVEPWRLFERVTASDELYFPSLLALAGELAKRDVNAETTKPTEEEDDGIDAPRVARRRLTWCDWTLRGRSPATLPHLTPDIIRQARAEGCLFARKFPPGAVRDPAHWDALLAEAAASGKGASKAASSSMTMVVTTSPGDSNEEERATKKARCDPPV